MDIEEQDVQRAVRALNKVRREWMRRPGVSAVDVGFPITEGQLREDQIALRAHVERKKPSDELFAGEAFPEEQEGIPVDVLEVRYEPSATPTAAGDAADAADDDDDDDGEQRPDPRHVARVTPLVGGVSVGNPRIAAGTLGAVVWDRTDGSPHILSNWHVLAGNDAVVRAGGCVPSGSAGQPYYQAGAGPSPEALASLEPYYQALASLEPYYQALASLEPYYQALASLEPYYQLLASLEPYYQSASSGQPFFQAAALGEPIYQPARFDGGTAADTVAYLSRSRLDRHMDAAIARLTGVRAYSEHVLNLGPLGRITGVVKPRLGMRVRKSGRSTGVTRGRIDGLSLSTTITWGDERHHFTDQIHIVPLDPWPQPNEGFEEVSEGGDSGAVWVVADTNQAVGLHFAGDVGGVAENEHALANAMCHVVEELDISFEPQPRVLEQAGAASEGFAGSRRALGHRGRAGSASEFATLVNRITRARGGDDARGGALSGEELEALRAVIDAVIGARR